MLDEHFVILGALLSTYGAMSYLIDTLKGKTKPNRVTWFLWALAPLIAFSAQIKEGVGWASLMTFVVGFNPLLILIASFVNKKSQWKIGKLDIFCGAISILGLLMWSITKNGNTAILFSIISDGFAGIPTIIKSYQEPETENYKVYLFAGINSLITLATIKKFNFANSAFAIYIFSICLIIFPLVKFKLGAKIQKQFS